MFKYTIDLTIYLIFLRMYTVDQALRFDYKHLLVKTIQKYNTNNNTTISSSYNDKFPSLALTGMTGYSTGYD